MEQYINKSVVVAEIERRMKKYATIDVGNSSELDALYGAKCKALMEILSFINTLEMKDVQEEPVSENLEEAAKRYSDNENPTCNCWECLFKSFKAGAQWQALNSLETIKEMEEQAFLAGVEAEQTSKSFSKDELLNGWMINL